jgi:hypothetical protein
MAGRSLTAGGRTLVECWLVGLEPPVAAWVVSTDGGAVALAWVVPPPSDGDLQLSDDDTRLSVTSGDDRWTEFAAAGGNMEVERAGGAARVTCRGSTRLQVLVAAGRGEPDRKRALEILARGPARLVEGWRQQVGSAPRLETPDETIARAFAWAWTRAGALATGGPTDAVGSGWTVDTLRSAATRFLADPASPDPAAALAVLGGALGGLWGVIRHASNDELHLRPLLPPDWPGMALRRLRAGRTLLDLELRRRRGDLVVRVHRRFGPRLVVTLDPRGGSFPSAVVDDVELYGGRARFEAADRHVILFRGPPA